MDSASLQDEDLYLMSNVQPDESGLPFVVYISERQGPHDVRVKVAGGPKAPPFVASVSVRPTVEIVAGKLSNSDLALVRQWIELNRQVIIDHWEGKIPSSRQVLNALKPLPKS
ncbi:MAG: DUF4160 domain-containing protein [Vitreimonas sp.]